MAAQPVSDDEPREQMPRPLTPSGLHAHLQRTVQRALQEKLADKVERIDRGLYLVPSTSTKGVVYTVTGDSPLDCTCEARWHMPMCVHRAAVWLRRWAAEGKVVALDDNDEVVVVTEVNAATLMFSEKDWPAMRPEPPK